MKIFGYSEFRKIIVNNFKIQKYEKGGIVVLLYVFLCVPVCPDEFSGHNAYSSFGASEERG